MVRTSRFIRRRPTYQLPKTLGVGRRRLAYQLCKTLRVGWPINHPSHRWSLCDMSGCSAAHLLECQKRYGSQSLHHPRNALKFVNEHGILQNCQPDQLPELHKQCDGAIIWIWWVVNNLCMATLSADQELWRQIMHQNQDMWTRWFWMTGPLRGSLYATSKGEDFTTAWVVGTHEWFSALTLTKF